MTRRAPPVRVRAGRRTTNVRDVIIIDIGATNSPRGGARVGPTRTTYWEIPEMKYSPFGFLLLPVNNITISVEHGDAYFTGQRLFSQDMYALSLDLLAEFNICERLDRP